MSEELIRRIGKLRVEAELDAEEAKPQREQLDVVDAAIRVAAANPSLRGAERRGLLKSVVPGATVSASGEAATKKPLTRQQKVDRVKDWINGLPPEQRANVDSYEWLEKQNENVRDVFMEASTDLQLDEAGLDSAEVDWSIDDLDQAEDDAETDAWLAGLENETRDENRNLYEEGWDDDAA